MGANMKCAIHQPNFFPWYPFFQKMQECDIFVILGFCQFEKNNYQNRFKMKGKFREWNTLSVNNKLQNIKEKTYLDPVNDYKKIVNNLPEYTDILNRFFPIFNENKNLYFVNNLIIKLIADTLNIKTYIVNDYPTGKTGTDRLVDICETVDCNTYISGIGAKKYLDESLFNRHNIKIEYQNENEMIRKPVLEILK